MRFFLVLMIPLGIYFVMFRHPASEVKTETAAPATVPAVAATTPSDFLKRPIDRTREVLQQNKARINDQAF